MPKRAIISQMFDIRPVDQAGNLDWKKIKEVESATLETRSKIKLSSFRKKDNLGPKTAKQKIGADFYAINQTGFPENKNKGDFRLSGDKQNEFWLGNRAENDDSLFQPKSQNPSEHNDYRQDYHEQLGNQEVSWKPPFDFYEEEYILESEKEARWKNLRYFFSQDNLTNIARSRFWRKSLFKFLATAASVTAVFALIFFVTYWINLRREVLGESAEGYRNLESAVSNIKDANFSLSHFNFQEAYGNFSKAAESINSAGGQIAELLRFAPLASTVSSGKNAIEAGKHLALAGQALSETADMLNSINNPINNESGKISFLELFRDIEKNLQIAAYELKQVNNNFEKINIDDIPEEKRGKFVEIKKNLPVVIRLTENFLSNSDIFVDLLGGKGPRKYLFLFQNNQEMRATGGFIGSYGLLDINQGRIRNFFIDGIFNPDGQLKEKIIPPEPIQKISAAWSLHDSNWWPDFPTSAKKAILFYEKTGGPTTDGIIALTPDIMKRMLEVSGPIAMPEYDTIITAENFVQETQKEVEVDKDKGEHDPKRILSDLAPLVMDRIFNSKSIDSLARTLDILYSGLNEKHIILYSENKELQKIISQQNWSGEIYNTSRDYLCVINSNINGFKTDGVIEEKIEHLAEIQADGSIVNEVIVKRKHNGGDSEYDWLNKVNANYMRLYVPEGSKLLEAEGQTREFVKAPLDYAALGFKKDPDVEKEESAIFVDHQTGTRVYTEAGKTVFANWTYVSPKEELTVRYKYLLPFKLSFEKKGKIAESYSLIAQKQSGSRGSKFVTMVKYPRNIKIVWNTPENIEFGNSFARVETDLKSDKFVGMVFAKTSVYDE